METKKNENVDLFANVSKYTNVGTKKDSIYKLEIFNGKTEKERKAIRRKIRNVRDAFVNAFASAKPNEKNEIAKDWQTYAKNVYKDIFIIFEANTTTDKITDLAGFVSGIRKELQPKTK